MEKPNLSTGRLPPDFALEEYRALNAEILARVGRQNTFFSLALVALGLASSLFVEDKIDMASPMVSGACAIILGIILLVLIEQDYQIAIIGTYVRMRIYPILWTYGMSPLPGWETYLAGQRLEMPSAVKLAMIGKYGLVGLPILAIDWMFVHRFLVCGSSWSCIRLASGDIGVVALCAVTMLVRDGVIFAALYATAMAFRE